MTSLQYDDVDGELATSIRRYCADHLAPVGDDPMPTGWWAGLAELGVLGLATPEGGGTVHVGRRSDGGARPGQRPGTPRRDVPRHPAGRPGDPRADRDRAQVIAAAGRRRCCAWLPVAGVIVLGRGRHRLPCVGDRRRRDGADPRRRAVGTGDVRASGRARPGGRVGGRERCGGRRLRGCERRTARRGKPPPTPPTASSSASRSAPSRPSPTRSPTCRCGSRPRARWCAWPPTPSTPRAPRRSALAAAARLSASGAAMTAPSASTRRTVRGVHRRGTDRHPLGAHPPGEPRRSRTSTPAGRVLVAHGLAAVPP